MHSHSQLTILNSFKQLTSNVRNGQHKPYIEGDYIWAMLKTRIQKISLKEELWNIIFGYKNNIMSDEI